MYLEVIFFENQKYEMNNTDTERQNNTCSEIRNIFHWTLTQDICFIFTINIYSKFMNFGMFQNVKSIFWQMQKKMSITDLLCEIDKNSQFERVLLFQSRILNLREKLLYTIFPNNDLTYLEIRIKNWCKEFWNNDSKVELSYSQKDPINWFSL